MKKLFLGMSLLAVAGLWTGCSNDDETINVSNDANAISFRAQGGTPTLRTVGTTTNDVDAFVVYGSDDVVGYTDLIFDGVTVARQASGGYDYNPKQYYGVGATTANFVAYSPVALKTIYFDANVSDISTTARFTYEVVAPDASGDKTQEDFLIAGTTFAPSATPVAINFQHALSRIFVQATSDLSETVTIKDLTLKGLRSIGAIIGTPASPEWLWEWTVTAPKDYSYILAPTGVAVKPNTTYPTLVTSMEQGMMVLPQYLVNLNNDQVHDVSSDFALEVVYDLANLEDQVAYVCLPDHYELEMGKQYVITVNFNSTVTNMIEINFDIDVTPWEYQLIDPLAP